MNKLEIGDGLGWYGCGWKLFKQFAAAWILLGIIFLVAGFVAALIPFVGPLLFMLVFPLLAAGFLMGADDVRQGASLEIGALFRAFTSDEIRKPLLTLGAIFLGLMIAASLVMMLLIGPSMMSMSPGPEGMGPQHLLARGGLAFVVLLVVYVLIAMCMFFAVPLATFDEVAPVEAVKTSFQAAVTNLLPFLLFLIVYIILAFIASIPFFLGLIVLLPIVFCSVYCAYRGVFK